MQIVGFLCGQQIIVLSQSNALILLISQMQIVIIETAETTEIGLVALGYNLSTGFKNANDHNALVKGDSHGNEQGFDQSFAKAVWEKFPGFAVYRQKGQ